MNWNKFLTILADKGIVRKSDNFSFEGDFGNPTGFGPTKEITGFYHASDNFYFDLLGQPNKYRNPGQDQITSHSKNDKYNDPHLFIKIVFSNIKVG